jgi:hypothetical protein
VDVTTVLPDRVVDAVPTAALAAAVIVALEVAGGETTAPTHVLASFGLHAGLILAGIVVFEAAWSRVFGDD